MKITMVLQAHRLIHAGTAPGPLQPPRPWVDGSSPPRGEVTDEVRPLVAWVSAAWHREVDG